MASRDHFPDDGSVHAMIGLRDVTLRVAPDHATGGIAISVLEASSESATIVLAPMNGVDLALRLVGAGQTLRAAGHVRELDRNP
jgi:hypothetical protein